MMHYYKARIADYRFFRCGPILLQITLVEILQVYSLMLLQPKQNLCTPPKIGPVLS